jgi:hypothetical protein
VIQGRNMGYPEGGFPIGEADSLTRKWYFIIIKTTHKDAALFKLLIQILIKCCYNGSYLGD